IRAAAEETAHTPSTDRVRDTQTLERVFHRILAFRAVTGRGRTDTAGTAVERDAAIGCILLYALEVRGFGALVIANARDLYRVQLLTCGEIDQFDRFPPECPERIRIEAQPDHARQS